MDLGNFKGDEEAGIRQLHSPVAARGAAAISADGQATREYAAASIRIGVVSGREKRERKEKSAIG